MSCLKKVILLSVLATVVFSESKGQFTQHQQHMASGFQDALDLFRKDQFAASREAFEKIEVNNENDAGSAQVAYYTALAALRGDFPEGPTVLEAFILDHPGHPLSHDASWELGNYFLAGRNYRKAIENFNMLQNVPLAEEKHPEYLFKQGYSYFQLKNYKQARYYFDRAKRYRGPFLAGSYYYAGYSAFKQNEFGQAVADFKQAEKSSEFSLKVPYMLAALYYQQNKLDSLIAYAAPLTNKAGLENKAQIHLLLAEAYYDQPDFSQAAFHYQAFLTENKGELSRDQKYKAGVANYESAKYDASSNFFKEVALVSDALGQVSSYFLGHSYIQQGNLPFASNSFSSAYKMDFKPGIKEEALFNYAKVNLEMGKFQEAVSALDNYLDQYPAGEKVNEAENLLSDALINTSNYLRAISHIEGMQQPSDRIKAAYQKVAFYQAMTYMRSNNYNGTLDHLNKSMRYPMDKSLLYQAQYWKGEMNAIEDKPDAAIQAFERLLAMRPPANDPSLIKAHYGLGYAYFNKGQYEKAENQFKTYTDKLRNATDKQHYDDALLRLGDTYYVQKKFDAAAATFRRAISEDNPYSDYAYFRSGVVANFQNDNSTAIRQLDQVINNYPNSLYWEDAVFQKAQIHMEDLGYSQGREVFSRLISAKPNSPFIPFALEGRAVANYSLKEYDKAIEDYKQILDQFPNASNGEAALVGLQESLSLQGRSGEFSSYLAEYRSSNPGSTNLQNVEFEAAKSLVFNQSYNEAIKALEGFIRNYPQAPQTPEAKYYLGDAYLRTENVDKALSLYYELENTTDVNLKNRVFQKIATIEFERGNFAKSIPYFEFTAENARSKAEEYEAYFGLMLAHYETDSHQKAIENADKILELGNITPDAEPNALLIKGKSLQAINNNSRATAAYETLVANYKTIQGAEALFELARMKTDLGQYAASNELIFEKSQPFSQYDYWYGKQFVQLARNYLAMEETFQAKATLESIIENSADATVRQEAEELLQTIDTTGE
ncbi:Tetratricopeptide repeat-containing protein [Cyclobacterium lianum]|uniref:Tetratricopeptide repeat-containing protein n=1 Tax=Cyclobacterium lianum TaxID=388280 RepID=A0A1M7M5H2_9BACT|nr:tetratricopeptide repeat protein [Cyclobacterium lianum]SHM85956.1 Tetratricopeptide repeat-containing protein [Cyclobacterium lianum]